MRIICERTWTCDGEGEYPGYLVEDEGRLFPAFTHGQMLECQRVQAELVKQHGNESFALLECEDGIWRESYFDGVWATYEPIEVDGMKVYALGADEWPWE